MKTGAKIDLKRWNKIQREIERAERGRVRIGVAEGPGRKLHKGTPLAKIFAAHEFGDPASDTPERPVLRPTFSRLDPRVNRVISRWAGRIIEGRARTERALTAVGMSGRAAVRRTLRARIDPPLQPETIAAKRRKGSRKRNPKPLINFGPLIGFEVVGV